MKKVIIVKEKDETTPEQIALMKTLSDCREMRKRIEIGDEVTWTPNNPTDETVTGFVMEEVSAVGGDTGYNVKPPDDSYGSRVFRLWKSRGQFVKTGKVAEWK